MDDVEELRQRFDAEFALAQTVSELVRLEGGYIGKKGAVKDLRSRLRSIPAEERAAAAPRIETLYREIERRIEARREELTRMKFEQREQEEWVDVTLPGRRLTRGSVHPITKLENRCLEILRSLGFTTCDGPEVESAYYNFDALNVPLDHPARDLQDTFWLENGLLLRSHTTSIQARVLESRPPLPLRIVARGRVYRNEAVDATHLAMFHQLEGFCVDEHSTLANLKHVLAELVKGLFGDRRFRFKPKYYPYTEPSIGLDIACGSCKGTGCPACHDVGWVTVIGAGMIHPAVFREFGYDPSEVSGFAFGWGTTRLAYQQLGLAKVKDLYSVNLDDLRYYDALSIRATVK